MSVTIKDLSKHLGISVSTVSKALNDYPDVSAETKTTVQEGAKEIGYHPSSAARNLRLKRTDKLGIVHPLKSFDSELFIGYYRGLTSAAERLGYNLILYTAPSDNPEALRKICRSKEVGGLILMGVNVTGILDSCTQILQDETMPFVILGHPIQNESVNVVSSDNRNGILNLMQHLISLQHTRIAYTARSDDAETNQEQLSAYKEALTQAGLNFDTNLVVEAPYKGYSGRDAMKALLELDKPPTAVLGFNDHVAVDAATYAQEKGLRIPEDIAFTGVGNLAYSRLNNPAITTLDIPLSEMGEQSLDILLKQINGASNTEKRTFPTKLIIRGSTLSSS